MVYEGNALVTGACGFSASYLIEELLKKNYRVFATDIKITDEFYKRFYDRVWFKVADLSQYADLANLFEWIKSLNGEDLIIFHTASVFNYSADWDLLYKVNVIGTENLLSMAEDYNAKKFILWSSLAVYGEVNKKTYNLPVTEDQILNDKEGGLYDQSKRLQEDVIIIKSTIPSIIMRVAPIYGEGSKYGFYTLMKYVKQHSVAGVPRNIRKRMLPMIHAEDVARVAIYLSDSKYNNKTYNICDDNSLNMLDTLKWVSFLTDAHMKVVAPMYLKLLKPLLMFFGKLSAWRYKKKGMQPKLETDAMIYMFGNYWFSNEKLKSTGFNFKYPDRRIGLVKTVDWYNENGWK